MSLYSAYGLGIRSAVDLPGRVADSEPMDPNVAIALENVPHPDGFTNVTSTLKVFATPDEVIYEFDGVGRVAVRNGRRIDLDLETAPEDPRLHHFLLGPAMGMLLHQRGVAVLHGSVVAIDGAAVGFLGGSSAGKSTLAAAFHRAGHSICADDLAVVTDKNPPTVRPGFPLLKLGPSGDGRPVRGNDGLTPVTRSFETSSAVKRFYRARRFTAEPVPLDRVYILDQGDSVSIEEIPPRHRIRHLVSHAYARNRLRATESEADYFDRVADIVDRVPVKRLRFPDDPDTIPNIVTAVTGDLDHAVRG